MLVIWLDVKNINSMATWEAASRRRRWLARLRSIWRRHHKGGLCTPSPCPYDPPAASACASCCSWVQCHVVASISSASMLATQGSPLSEIVLYINPTTLFPSLPGGLTHEANEMLDSTTDIKSVGFRTEVQMGLIIEAQASFRSLHSLKCASQIRRD